MSLCRAAVVAEALTWQGTPYHAHARLKGVGVDCAQILIGIGVALGFMDDPKPEYAMEWHLHRSEELYAEWMDCYARRIEQSEAREGDFALFKFGRTYSHGGVLIDRQTVLHAYMRRGVILTRFDEEPLYHRSTMFWSIF